MAKERTKGVGRDMVAEPMQDFWVYRLAPLARTSTQLRRTATLPGARGPAPPFKATKALLAAFSTRLFGSCASASSSSGMDASPTSQLPGPPQPQLQRGTSPCERARSSLASEANAKYEVIQAVFDALSVEPGHWPPMLAPGQDSPASPGISCFLGAV